MVIHQVRKSCARYTLIQSTIRPFKELAAASNSQSDKLKLKGRTLKTYPLYETLVSTRDDLKRAYRGSKTAAKNTLFYLDKARAKGFKQAGKLTNFQILRQSAFVDMNEQLPKIESDVLPIIKPYIGKSTGFGQMPNQKKMYLSFGGTALKMHRILCKNVSSLYARRLMAVP